MTYEAVDARSIRLLSDFCDHVHSLGVVRPSMFFFLVRSTKGISVANSFAVDLVSGRSFSAYTTICIQSLHRAAK